MPWGNGLLAVAFDSGPTDISSRPVPVAQGVQRSAASPAKSGDTANYGVTDRGTLVYLASGAVAGGAGTPVGRWTDRHLRTLAWVSRDGREDPLAAPPRAYSYPRVSPDGTQVAVDVRDAESDIWVWSLERATLTRLTFDPLLDRFPVWSPDGRRLASSQRDGSRGNLFWQMADGTGQAERVAKGGNNSQVFPTSFSPDGTRLVAHGTPTVHRWTTSASCRSGLGPTVKLRRCWRPCSVRQTHRSRLTGAGSPTNRTSPESWRCTCARFRR